MEVIKGSGGFVLLVNLNGKRLWQKEIKVIADVLNVNT